VIHGLPMSLRGRDFMQVSDLNADEISAILNLAFDMKREQKVFTIPTPKTLVMLYFNPSLRTRTSFEIGCRQLGITPVHIDAQGEGWMLEWRDGATMNGQAAEHAKDAARVLSRYADAVGLRSYPPMLNLAEDRLDPLVNAFRRHSTVPVINLESATSHPCQGLGDLMTLRELFPEGVSGKKVVLTWAPGPQPFTQSVANTFIRVAAMAGADVTLAHPEGFDLADDLLASARELAATSGGKVQISNSRDDAFRGADVVYAKSWVSSRWYGDWEAEQQIRAGISDDWTVTQDAMDLTHRARFMHPLPLRRNVVATDAVVDGPDCVVYQQSENRLHVQKALLMGLLQ
jgi:N-acetylornithine carbamoyltransferase